eukprot:5335561-Amphidinium_carterae.3
MGPLQRPLATTPSPRRSSGDGSDEWQRRVAKANRTGNPAPFGATPLQSNPFGAAGREAWPLRQPHLPRRRSRHRGRRRRRTFALTLKQDA